MASSRSAALSDAMDMASRRLIFELNVINMKARKRVRNREGRSKESGHGLRIVRGEEGMGAMRKLPRTHDN